MTAQQGFEYEKNAANYLKKLGYVKLSFQPAGAGHDQPDLIVFVHNKTAGVELKITDASAGSLVLKYDAKNKSNPWGFGDISKDDKEKLFIANLAKELGLFDIIKKQWKDVPYKREKDDKWEATAGKLTQEQRYKRDLAKFKDIKVPIPAQRIEQYYNKKNTYYVNIGTHGFYLFGSKDPLGLNAGLRAQGRPHVKPFNVCAEATGRARVQYKGSGNYQFTFEMQFKVREKSIYNIAPISKSSVEIKKSEANTLCFE